MAYANLKVVDQSPVQEQVTPTLLVLGRELTHLGNVLCNELIALNAALRCEPCDVNAKVPDQPEDLFWLLQKSSQLLSHACCLVDDANRKVGVSKIGPEPPRSTR